MQAVGKGDKPEQAVRDATALGAQSVRFVHSERGVAKSSSDHRRERLLRVAAQVARQCGRADIPQIFVPRPLSEALADLPTGGLRIACGFAEDARPLLQIATTERIRSGVTILIGPEGGLSDEELEAARAVGFQVVDLGPYVLRTEVACTMVLSALRACALAAAV
jgi:16S rRNA (uracil1498-N3)-methyltransferase